MELAIDKLKAINFPVNDRALLGTLMKELDMFITAKENEWIGLSCKRDKQNLNRLVHLYERQNHGKMYAGFMRLSEGCKESLCNMTIHFTDNAQRLDTFKFVGNEFAFYEAAKILLNCKATKRNQSIFHSISMIWSYLNYKYPCQERSDKYVFISEVLSLLPIEDLDSILRSLRRYKER